ncbi:MoaD/ThiS family protein [Pseudonocardia sp. TRM90224]|uniref:MoaD/ThiS family protein n=1 Tax=Pseudonocardia sp. TRM90224 TaxID=2812678 RepID=UPI001E4BCEB1|nr:MoaD/ThiS family protein [Pseudonocardia sp. TRM90224]
MSTTTTTLVTVRYFAAARAAAGVESEPVELAAESTVDDLLDALRARHEPAFARVLQRCSFLLDEVAVRDRTTVLPHAATVDVLPPFAGG